MRTGFSRSMPSSSTKRSASKRPSFHSAKVLRSRVSEISNRRSKQARIFALPYLAASSLQPPLAEAVGAELAADVAEHQLGRAAVGADDALDVVARLMAALVAHRRQVQALVEHLARLARAASRHRPADVALVRDRAAEAEQRAVDEHRAEHAHVRRVRAAAVVGMVDQEGVALGDVAAEFRDHGAAAGRERADMQRQHDVLRDHLALGIHQRAGGVLRFTHDRGEAGAEQRVLHLPHDAGEARLHHFEIDGVDVHCRFLRHDQILVVVHPRGLAGVDHGGAVELIENGRSRQGRARRRASRAGRPGSRCPCRPCARGGFRAAHPSSVAPVGLNFGISTGGTRPTPRTR